MFSNHCHENVHDRLKIQHHVNNMYNNSSYKFSFHIIFHLYCETIGVNWKCNDLKTMIIDFYSISISLTTESTSNINTVHKHKIK